MIQMYTYYHNYHFSLFSPFFFALRLPFLVDSPFLGPYFNVFPMVNRKILTVLWELNQFIVSEVNSRTMYELRTYQ